MKQMYSKEELIKLIQENAPKLEHKYEIKISYVNGSTTYTGHATPFYSLKENFTKAEIMERVLQERIFSFVDTENNYEGQIINLISADEDGSTALALTKIEQVQDWTGAVLEDLNYYINVYKDGVKILEFETTPN